MLTVGDTNLVKVTLDTLEAILSVGKQGSNNGVNDYATLIEGAHGKTDDTHKVLSLVTFYNS
jgi:hypothetical protein